MRGRKEFSQPPSCPRRVSNLALGSSPLERITQLKQQQRMLRANETLDVPFLFALHQFADRLQVREPTTQSEIQRAPRANQNKARER